MWLRYGNKIHSLDPYRKLSKTPWFLSSYPFSDTPLKKPKQAPLQERRMIDRFRLRAKGGDGGSGCSSLRRGRTDRHGKPDGGNGGRGGDVILECSSTIWDLSSLHHHVNAKRGGLTQQSIASISMDSFGGLRTLVADTNICVYI